MTVLKSPLASFPVTISSSSEFSVSEGASFGGEVACWFSLDGFGTGFEGVGLTRTSGPLAGVWISLLNRSDGVEGEGALSVSPMLVSPGGACGFSTGTPTVSKGGSTMGGGDV